jgi:AcrR family transcriptional regulator
MGTRAPAMSAEDRRSAIVASTLPLLLERGPNISTRQIAEAAGIAEGTIFRVFDDKDAVIRAAVEHAFDPQLTERALASIDRSLAFDRQLEVAVAVMQRRFGEVGRLIAALGNEVGPRRPPTTFPSLTALFEPEAARLRVSPAAAAKQLRAITFAFTHPLLFGDEPLPPDEIVTLFLDGARHPRAARSARTTARASRTQAVAPSEAAPC